VLCLHGWGATLFSFQGAFELLPPLGFRVIAADLRGFGLSDKPSTPESYSLDANCADIGALLDALEIERVALVGQSMGGGVALRVALDSPHRVRRLALINPTGLGPVAYLTALRLVPARIVNALGGSVVPRAVVEFILCHIAYGNKSLVTERAIDEYWAPTQQPGFVRAARAALSEFEWEPFSDEQLARLAVPTVVILGRKDRLVRDAERSVERLARAEVHALDGGHCVHEEHPREVYDIIGSFFRAK
jgi:4,5:9,10-diseco-3-hydroxy-5,9,17-trioxoandrosta-1(10),2-diene-4-oate hydrolase